MESVIARKVVGNSCTQKSIVVFRDSGYCPIIFNDLGGSLVFSVIVCVFFSPYVRICQ